jgi:hypothetical protein
MTPSCAEVFNRLGFQLAEYGTCRPDPKIRLCLACGRVMAPLGYENQVSAVVAQLLLKGEVENNRQLNSDSGRFSIRTLSNRRQIDPAGARLLASRQ